MNAQLAGVLLVPFAYALMWAVEARWPARAYAPVERWSQRGVTFFFVVAVTGSVTPLAWSAIGLTSWRIFDLGGWGWWGLPVGVLATSGVSYGWHRAAHRFDLLWRATHQLHHSARRVDVPGAFYTHPLEVVVKTTLGLVVGTVVLGLAPPVAAMTSSLLAVLSILQHWNINTPRWLGLLLPRPEMHALHHEAGVHARNYGDLPLWDLLFGTYVNLERFEGRVGFDTPSGSLGDMLLMRDVSSPGRAPPLDGARPDQRAASSR